MRAASTIAFDLRSIARCRRLHHQIVAVDHFAASGKAQYFGYRRRLATGNAGGVLEVVGNDAARDLAAVRPAHDDDVAAREAAFDALDTGGKQALAVEEGSQRAVIDGQRGACGELPRN